MDVIELQNLLAERELRIGFYQLQHPFFVVLELNFAVVDVLVDVAFKLLNELLFGEAVDFLGHEGLVVAKGGNHSVYQGEALVVAAKLMGGPTHCPTLGDEFLYLLGVDHHGQSRQVEVVAKALPRDGVSGLNHNGQSHYLYVGEPQLLSKECQGVLASFPECIGQARVFCLVQHMVQGGNNSPRLRFFVLRHFHVCCQVKVEFLEVCFRLAHNIEFQVYSL